MVRKFFVAMMLAVALVFIGSQAEAREVYVGSYNDGTAVYVLTETIYSTSDEERGGSFEPTGYHCKVRADRDYLQYTFFCRGSRSSWRYENSEGYSGYVYDGSSPVAASILNYCINH